MSAVRQDIPATAVSSVKIEPYPASEKIYVQGSRPDIQVPMRKISLSDTVNSFGTEKNTPVYVYDTSGIYTDPKATIDLRKGLHSSFSSQLPCLPSSIGLAQELPAWLAFCN